MAISMTIIALNEITALFSLLIIGIYDAYIIPKVEL
jgi:hypothetical protein